MKLTFYNIIFLFFSILIYSQNIESELNSDDSLDFYKNIYKSGDSLSINNKNGKINPHTYRVADSLDSHYPSGYYEKALDYISKSKFNDAAFLYFVGQARFKYFNSSNPNYKPSGDGALYVSLSYLIGEPIGMYLKINIDNYISLLKSSQQYCIKNDYKFYLKKNNPENFEMQNTFFSNQILDLEKNRKKYIKNWKKERKELEKNIE